MACRWRGLRCTRAAYRYSMSCREYMTPSESVIVSMPSDSYSERNASRFFRRDRSTPTVSANAPRVPLPDLTQWPL